MRQGPVGRWMVLVSPAGHMDKAGDSKTSVMDGHCEEGNGSYSAMSQGSQPWRNEGKAKSREPKVPDRRIDDPGVTGATRAGPRDSLYGWRWNGRSGSTAQHYDQGESNMLLSQPAIPDTSGCRGAIQYSRYSTVMTPSCK
jgi:hypothetical protein